MRRCYSGYGYVEDDRDLDYRASDVLDLATRAEHVDWHGAAWVGNQCETPHCCGFAATAALAVGPVHRYVCPHSVYFLAKHCDEFAGEDYEGTSVRASLKVLRMLGLIVDFLWLDGADEVSGALEFGPLVLGLPWRAGLETPDDEGIVRFRGRLLGGHAICAVGRDRAFITLQQSRGRRHGDRGRVRLPWEDLDRMLEDGEAALPRPLTARQVNEAQ